MPPQTRRRRQAQADGQAAGAPLLLPPLPDEIWEHIIGCFTENRDYFGFACVCKRFRDLVRHGRRLETTGFIWNRQPEFSSHRRAELFVDWLATRVGRPCSSLELQLVPEPTYEHSPSSLGHALWCVLGQLAPQLTSLNLKICVSLMPKVSGWVAAFSRLESLSLVAQDGCLTVSTSLAGLTRLSSLVLRSTVCEALTAQDELYFAEFHDARLALPESNFLPTSLRSLRMGSPLMQTLPSCLSSLTGLTGLFLDSRRQVPADILRDRLLPLAPGLEALWISGGMAPPSFLPHLAAFSNLQVLDLSRSVLREEGNVAGPDGQQQAIELLQQGLAPLTNLVHLSLCDTGLRALPPAVTAMSRLELLDCSMNQASLRLPAGPYLSSLREMAIDWKTVAGSPPAVLASLHNLEQLCIAAIPAAPKVVADALRSLAKLPQLSVLYSTANQELGSNRSVKAALKQLRRAKPAMQLRELTDCPF